MGEKSLLLYGGYNLRELSVIEDLFIKNGVECELESHITNRGNEYYYHVFGYCTKSEQSAIIDELHEIIKRRASWGKHSYKEI